MPIKDDTDQLPYVKLQNIHDKAVYKQTFRNLANHSQLTAAPKE